MATKFRIHPAIGIARLGNSPGSFYLAPETTGAPPIECDADGIPVVKDGKEQPVTQFKDGERRIRRQAARFRVFIYDDTTADGREVKIGDTLTIVDRYSGQRRQVRIDDIHWTVYLANKKAGWYEFQQTAGEHGYSAGHKLRNADITDTEKRQKLIIDPGPRTVWFQDPKHRQASFAHGTSGGPETFPPPLVPNSVTTLGELRCTQQENLNRLLVLGGHGNSGSMLSGFGNPKIENYANNDGWFDDISDGPVTASLAYTVLEMDNEKPPEKWATGTVAVDDPAWVIVGYPRYAPQLTDIITMDDLVFDISVRYFGYAPFLFGIPPFDGTSHYPTADSDAALWRDLAVWNTQYKPYFQRDIRPISGAPQQLLFRDGSRCLQRRRSARNRTWRQPESWRIVDPAARRRGSIRSPAPSRHADVRLQCAAQSGARERSAGAGKSASAGHSTIRHAAAVRRQSAFERISI